VVERNLEAPLDFSYLSPSNERDRFLAPPWLRTGRSIELLHPTILPCFSWSSLEKKELKHIPFPCLADKNNLFHNKAKKKGDIQLSPNLPLIGYDTGLIPFCS
jgi:hypothetical protein